MKHFAYPLAAVFIIISLQLAFGAEYVSGGAGAVQSFNRSNSDEVEFGSEKWFTLNVAIGDDAFYQLDNIKLGGEAELFLVPMMSQHGQNSGGTRMTADGQTVTAGSLLVNAVPSMPLSDGISAYVTGGVGVGFGNSGVGAGLAYQGGAGLQYAITDDVKADLSLRYRNVSGLTFAGPELRFVWTFK